MQQQQQALLGTILENLKTDKSIWEPVVKASEKYHAALRALSSASTLLSDALVNVADHATMKSPCTADLGAGILQISRTLKSVDAKREAVARSLMDDVITPLTANVEANRKNAIKIEKDYLQNHQRVVKEIKKAESESAKAGKKGADALKQAVAAVNDRVKEMETLRQSKLRQVIVEERKRHCFFIMHISTVINHDLAFHEEATQSFHSQIPVWTQLAVSPENLPPEVENLVEVQQRTLIPIQGGGARASMADVYAEETRNFSSYDATEANYYEGGDADWIVAGDHVRALYEYEGSGENLGFLRGRNH
eukprot:Lithocolla_globosa_v1_NODE_6975_length_1008_cov_5.326338.p1 type:complete len:308 gc:universal NODE_6975_length_1008_cov_5.326338:34-957(+)